MKSSLVGRSATRMTVIAASSSTNKVRGISTVHLGLAGSATPQRYPNRLLFVLGDHDQEPYGDHRPTHEPEPAQLHRPHDRGGGVAEGPGADRGGWSRSDQPAGRPARDGIPARILPHLAVLRRARRQG